MSYSTKYPTSKLLSNAVVGGGGAIIPPGAADPPAGLGVIVLYVPVELLQHKSPVDIQSDLGLPWADESGDPVWFDEPPAPERPH